MKKVSRVDHKYLMENIDNQIKQHSLAQITCYLYRVDLDYQIS